MDEKPTTKPTHYKVVCISMYTKDIEALDAKVDELKARGFSRANKSWLIRTALAQLDLSKIPLGSDGGCAAERAAQRAFDPTVAARPITWDPRQSMRLRRLTPHELAIAMSSPAIVGLLAMRPL